MTARRGKVHRVAEVIDAENGICESCGPVRIYVRGKRGTWACSVGHRDTSLWVKYRISLDDYNQILASQHGLCAICGNSPEVDGKDFCVDHDHTCCPKDRSCGRCIRGLLCRMCNWGLGHFKDDPQMFRQAIAYLEKGQEP